MPDSFFTETLADDSSFNMVFVEGGTFMMGSEDSEADSDESPIHNVKLDAFYLGKYPVTQRQWELVMDTNPSFFKGPDRPVEQVSWEECQVFLQKLNDQTGKNYRLPTEAEWEFAARGGTNSQGYVYAGSDKLKEAGWFFENSHRETKEVGQKMPNELGLHDISGNVYEWCQDWFDGGYYQQCADRGVTVNPHGPDSGSHRVRRGGSWLSTPQYCRVAYRRHWQPEVRNNRLGFRLAMSLQGGV